MEHYHIALGLFGAVVLLTAWIPTAFRRLPLSLPIFCIVIGMLVGQTIFNPIAQLDSFNSRLVIERMTEFTVIVALMGAGLKIDRRVGLRSWALTWRLLGLVMPLGIVVIALGATWILGLGAASAILLAACLAPTDPVLASDVQVGPPETGTEDEVRFALTSEAGLNDGLSFPFVYLAIAIALAPEEPDWFSHWLLFDVVWRLLAGIAMGWIIGKLLGLATFRLPREAALVRTGDGFVALGITCIAYSLTELVHGYGFLAVFVAALSFRSIERHHEFHKELHDFSEQIERLLMMVLLVCFGAAVSVGQLIDELDWRLVSFALFVLLIVRPVFGWVCLPSILPKGERAAIAIFGIRGLGSIYYLAFATGAADFEGVGTLWSSVALIVLISIVTHGLTVTPAMRWLDRQRRTAPAGKQSAVGNILAK
ncbi:sodium:proton antiporter [Sinorhizobium medicae]|uniref:Sodium/hydrogen exchanger n=1 Tax=Sinorhizobium medicae (strain WSM419) TaxID=366394 RepID=A6UKE3_SINMW|nr:sodium:proton antiporter [Sinorhizobium medicae]ABR64123.1 sodium/hydrogen exchanger [Sinorhizobium medicae WSM419]MBO1944499.1 sodium:proton antiporter [Sinorhizobium medicae]MDX0404707.1 sodium:proton antiporter [Sinorhizobium medicae]MDX0416983.1 sodium:proton antiporter [Sinorhizobium medicae]MDX0432431.1 sodium:proton antiporter [Sinorhizobium medicae]